MRGLGRLLFRLLAVLGSVVALTTLTPFDYWYATKLSGPWNIPRGDVLIVLSASAGPNGILARDSYLRAMYAVLAWREAHFRRIIICGRDAGPAMKTFMAFSGVPPALIEVEGGSVSTHENAVNAATLLRAEPGRKMLLTSDFHMYRAAAAFRKAGLVFEPMPVPDVRKYSGGPVYRWPLAVDLADETVKIVYYRWREWI